MKTERSSINIFKSGLFLFILLFAQAAADAQVRASYDSVPYNKITDTNWQWNGTTQRTIYNPLDGGVLLKYSFSSQGNSDGCSGGAPREKLLFQPACLAHDAAYDAPFALAGFPGYPAGGSLGQDIADYLFYKDMKLINNTARARNNGVINFVNDSAADVFYTAVILGGNFRDKSEGKSVQAKGGVVAVVNDGPYIMTLKVSWTAPDGSQKSEEITKPVGQTAMIPLSIGATNIKAECWVVGGARIFTKNFSGPGMYAYSIGGISVSPTVRDGLVNNAKAKVKAPDCDRCITFSNQAGYAASMTVMYFVTQNIGGVNIQLPKSASTPKIIGGMSQVVKIPQDLAPNSSINVIIEGVATIKKPVFSTSIPSNFTGQKCFKAENSIFNATGGACN